MTREISLDEINAGDSILYRGKPATVKKVWRSVSESPIKFAVCGVEIERIDEHGDTQKTRLSFPELTTDEYRQIKMLPQSERNARLTEMVKNKPPTLTVERV